jgi:hypothetical protein
MSVAGVTSNRSKNRTTMITMKNFGIKLELGTTREACIICLIHYPIKQDIVNHESSVVQ